MREIRNLCLAFFMRRGFVQYGFKQWTGKSIETVYDINTGELIVRQAVVVKRIQTKDSGGSNSSGNFLISPVGSVSRSFKSVPLGAPMSPLGTPSISPKKVAPINTSASLLSNTTPSPPMSLRKSGTSSANSSFRRNLRENRSPQRQEIMKNALESMNGGTVSIVFVCVQFCTEVFYVSSYYINKCIVGFRITKSILVG